MGYGGRNADYMSMKLSNQTKREVVEKLFASEPFSKYMQIKDKILGE